MPCSVKGLYKKKKSLKECKNKYDFDQLSSLRRRRSQAGRRRFTQSTPLQEKCGWETRGGTTEPEIWERRIMSQCGTITAWPERQQPELADQHHASCSNSPSFVDYFRKPMGKGLLNHNVSFTAKKLNGSGRSQQPAALEHLQWLHLT